VLDGATCTAPPTTKKWRTESVCISDRLRDGSQRACEEEQQTLLSKEHDTQDSQNPVQSNRDTAVGMAVSNEEEKDPRDSQSPSGTIAWARADSPLDN
jgi:hypothetical protein